MLARGLLTGLAVTWRNLTKRSVTAHYPDALPELPPRSRGVIALMEENCTVCMLCARECPAWCIYIDSHKESAPPATEGGRERSHNMLDRFAIDYSLCMYCGICVDVCPFDALHWSPEFEYAEQDIRGLTHEKDRLQEWMWTVPPPPALDPAAAEPKEIAVAEKAAARIAAAAQAELDALADPGQEAPRVRVRAREFGADNQTGATATGQPLASGGQSGATPHGRDDPGADEPPDPSAGSQRGDRPSDGDL